MQHIIPDFYESFRCKADTCQHTCCRGWEIDIDDTTAAQYQAMSGSIGDDLRTSMVCDEEGNWQFNLSGSDECCPFLQPNGLCRLILTLGEEALCDICTLHPRFYEVVDTPTGPVELGGVGLCCEKSCELLLSSDGPLQFIQSETKELLSFAALLTHIQLPIPTAQQVYAPKDSTAYGKFVLDCLSQTEPINNAWTQQIQRMQAQEDSLLQQMTTVCKKGLPSYWNRIYQYILYRQLEQCNTWPIDVVTAYAHMNTTFIVLAYLQTGCLAEAIRVWSEQIEYDTENVAVLLDMLVSYISS